MASCGNFPVLHPGLPPAEPAKVSMLACVEKVGEREALQTVVHVSRRENKEAISRSWLKVWRRCVEDAR